MRYVFRFDRLMQALGAKGWSQSDLARKVNVRPQSVSEWKAGRCPREARIEKMASLLGVNADWLRGESGLREASCQYDPSEPDDVRYVTESHIESLMEGVQSSIEAMHADMRQCMGMLQRLEGLRQSLGGAQGSNASGKTDFG